MGFGNIVNNKKSILNNFGSISKSLELIKTEKELFESLNEKISKLKRVQANIEGTKKEIVTLLNEKPTEERTYYLNLPETGENEEAVYYTYKISSTCEEKAPVISNMTVEEMSAGDKDGEEELKMKNHYNDLSRKYFSIQEKVEELEKLKKNLKKNSNHEYKLTLQELERYF